jgi:hypothetical protein
MGAEVPMSCPVHDLTLNEIERFKILSESVTVSETKDGFAIEIANVELEQYHDGPGTLMDIGGITFTRCPDSVTSQIG